MNILSDINFFDFYYNGHYLSEFGGYVGSTDGGFKKYSLLPSRTYVTDKQLNYDGNIIFDSYLEPRSFKVPIVFESIDDAGIRTIAGWLNTKTDEKFFFADDTLYINCVLDSNETDLDSISGVDGECELTFLANDPYYYSMNTSNYIFQDVTGGTLLPMINGGNAECYPKIKIMTSQSFVMSVYDINSKVIQQFSVTSPMSPVTIDSKYCTCFSGSYNLFNNTEGKFPVFPSGVFYISFNTDIKEVDVDFVPRFI